MESLWEREVSIKPFPTLCEDKKTDVLIIGGGIAGILTVYMLKQSGINCILLERSRICSGTTGKTSGKITCQHGLIYQKLLKNFGAEKAKGYLEANRKAMRCFEKMCRDIDFDSEIKDNFVYSLDNRKKLEKEMDALRTIGFDAEFCTDLPFSFEIAGAVKFPKQAQFNPLKFIRVIAKDLPIYENSFVRELKGNTAVTDKAEIKAENIVVTSHFPFINKHGSYFLKLYQNRSYMLALENAQKLNGMYVDESGRGFTLRNYKQYLLFGGASGRTGSFKSDLQELREYAQLYYPQSKESCAWGAQDCMSLDNIPYIGRYSSKTENLFTASGFNKWGMTGAMLSANLLCDMISGNNNEYAQIFSPSRSILHSQLFLNGFEAVKNLCSFGKRCPHLGCALKWNKSEHSWDCPCHGSRFDEQGNILDNPANGDLSI